MKRWIVGMIVLGSGMLAGGQHAAAQTAYEEISSTVPARVEAVVSEREERIMGTDASTTVQTLNARLLDGDAAGTIVTFENDLVQLDKGDRIFLSHVRDMGGVDIYLLQGVDRGWPLFYLLAFFVALLVAFSGWHGLRALASLALSILGIIFVLLPALLAGYDPILMSLLVASVILALALFGTHGFNALSTIAYLGTIAAVLVSAATAWWAVGALRLSGYGSDASVYLNFATRGQLDLAGLLLGSIIIGALGVLDDISITQASVVQELRRANHALHPRELYRRALKVGHDHVGSLVNTLALAYVGAALPLVLLFSTSQAPLYFTLNQEVIAAELARILIGSIGLILAVPLTTAIAAWWFGNREVDNLSDGHYHSHHHY